MTTQAEKDRLAELAARIKSTGASLMSNGTLLAKAVDALTVDQPAPTPTPTPVPPAKPTFETGVQYPATWPNVDDTIRKAMCATTVAAGATWVRLDVEWRGYQPTSATAYDTGLADRIASHMAIAASYGLKVLLEVYGTPAWASGSTDRAVAPKDPAAFGTFMGWLANRYKGKVAAYEIWNEQNNTRFLNPSTAAAYVPLLKAGYAAVKAVDPSALVVVGGCEYVDTAYLTALYAAGAKGNYDVMTCHPYPGYSDLAPLTSTRANASTPAEALNKWNPLYLTEWLRIMAANGDSSPVWLTEYGWSTHNNNPTPASNSQWGVTEAQQAQYAADMIGLIRSRWPQVTNAFWYSARNSHESNVQQHNYGLMRDDLSRKPAVDALAKAQV